MAEGEAPDCVAWIDRVKQTQQLTYYFGRSVGKNGWTKVCTEAVAKFNELATKHALGVSFQPAQDAASANVEFEIATGNFQFTYPGRTPETVAFDAKKVHGLTRVMIEVTQRRNAPRQFRIEKAYIFMPSQPSGRDGKKIRKAGDGVRLVIAVHEMIHACGVGNGQHSTDDVFAWPTLSMGSKPEDDTVQVVGPPTPIPTPAGQPQRMGHATVNLPPIFMMPQTADKIRWVWGPNIP